MKKQKIVKSASYIVIFQRILSNSNKKLNIYLFDTGTTWGF